MASPTPDRSVALLRTALGALVRERRSAKILEGMNTEKVSQVEGRFKNQYQDSVRAALELHPRLQLDVMPDAIYHTDHPVIEATERKGDLVEVLYSEGVRSVIIEAGVTPVELDQLADILVTPWHERKENDADLATAVWESDFSRVRLELVERLTDEAPDGDSPALRRVEEMIEALETEAEAAEESGLMRQDEVEVLLRLREDVGTRSRSAELKLGFELVPRLQEDLDLLRKGQDLTGPELPAVLGLCMHTMESPERVELLGRAMIDFLVRQIVAGNTSTAGLHRLLELLDPECTPQLRGRASVVGALAEFTDAEVIEHLRLAVPPEENSEWRAILFCLGTVLTVEDLLRQVVMVMPVWAIRVMADAVVLREQGNEVDLFESVRSRVLSDDAGRVRLGLGMATRVDDARLGEPILGLTSSPDAEIREAALYALRRFPSQRLRTRVQELFVDPAEGVRLEALRHVIAARDTQQARRIEARLLDPAMEKASEAEIRALCICMGRTLKGEADGALMALALGQKRSANPHTQRMALQGLRASGSKNARTALQRVVGEVPRHATEAESILREMGA
ncbi:MAG TPA: hypothetical protein PKW90_10525 [Myxococcota bacterium]|nr:hypothetical protein [Myxococcota bacterium]